ncbi:hypothetical protein Ocin01_12723 [Orchesella cincta]|uniref:Failed axon connections n=1 Tax=Orchesella cincta TaxID=48709 RepID=A0A1D2MLR0_ORCCI|nr:hypothetical protein Ocin01_12723 [Orchesella cincta]
MPSWLTVLAVAPIAYFVLNLVWTFIQNQMLQSRLRRWNTSPKDVVILHGFPPAKALPNLSPYIMKVETYLRLANLRYTLDKKDYFGPKGKSPWITLNGQHIADSEFIIEFLGKKFEKNFSQKSSDLQLATANVVRTMLEEFFTCVLGLERMIYNDYSKFSSLANIPLPFYYYMRHMIKTRFWEQGIGRHSQEEVTQIMTKKLQAVSTLLGNQKFFGGDEICEDDCGIFAVLAQCLWGLPDNSVYEKLMNGECSNLKEYCLRIKEKLWADWDHCLAK